MSWGRSRFFSGLPPVELWGVSTGPRKPKPRSAQANKRQAQKHAARRAGVTLKSYLRGA